MNIAFLLDRLADGSPEAAAFVGPEGTTTWQQARDRVARIAGVLNAAGVGSGDRVGLLCPNRPAFVECLLACAWIGALVVPVNTRLAAAEVEYQLNDAGTKLVLCDATLEGLTAQAAASVPRMIVGEDLDGRLTATNPVEMRSLPSGHTLGLFYTSGTTGAPKGVMLTHHNMLANSANIAPQIGFCAKDVHLHAAPMFHLADLAAFFGQMFGGAAAHIFQPAFDPDVALELMEQFGVSTTMLAPTMIGMLLRAESLPGRDLSSLRVITYGGAPIADSVMRAALEAFPGDLVQGFGQTEATQTVCYMQGDEHRRALKNPSLLRRCGKPIPGIHVRIVDAEDRPVPTGISGEVVVRGATIMAGYWNKPEATADTLRNGWLHTGDVGYLDEDGFLTLVDRKKDMIITGAENVYSPEVENAVASHPDVAECAVIGVPDEKWGERVHAVVQLLPGTGTDEAELEAHCRERIAGFKLPRSWSFVDAMPKTAFGKIQKSELRKPWWEAKDRAVN